MQIIDFKIKLLERKAELLRTRSQDAVLSALDLLALVKLRINRKGENSEGSNFTPYSKDYKKERVKRGAQVAYKDFNVTGRLQANIAPQIENETANTTTVSIGARSKENRDKLAGQFKRDGNILTPNKTEIELLKKVYATRRKKRIAIP
jgi:hypothetical protein